MLWELQGAESLAAARCSDLWGFCSMTPLGRGVRVNQRVLGAPGHHSTVVEVVLPLLRLAAAGATCSPSHLTSSCIRIPLRVPPAPLILVLAPRWGRHAVLFICFLIISTSLRGFLAPRRNCWLLISIQIKRGAWLLGAQARLFSA